MKAQASCGYYFVLLLIYLHMMGCLFFFTCLVTYRESSYKLSELEGLGLCQKASSANPSFECLIDRYTAEY